jgi:hypothetical protein
MGENKTWNEKEELPPRGTQPVAMNLHTEALILGDLTVVVQSAEACSKLRRRVDSKRTQWKKVGKRGAASQEPIADVNLYSQ